MLLFNSCEMKKGGPEPNLPPVITITEYFGADDINEVGDAEIFQQTINWSAYDPDGVVKGFSFKVLNQDGEPIPTPGYEVLDDEESKLVEEIFNVSADGNFLDEATQQKSAFNILHLKKPLSHFADKLEIELETLLERIAIIRAKLHWAGAGRNQR